MPDRPPAPLRLASAADLTATFREHGAPLVRYARAVTGDADTAHDVVQDVFVKLWEARDALVVTVSIRSLLYTMTRNRALNALRARVRLAADVDVERDDGPAALTSSDAPDAALDAETLARHLRRWMAALPPRRAEAFSLSRFHGLTHAEIARVMGLSVRTVDTHVVHALRDLRVRLDALHAVREPAPER